MDLRGETNVSTLTRTTGKIASMPTWTFSPDQMKPGLSPECALSEAVGYRLEVELHKRRQPCRPFRQTDVEDLRLQIGEPVFDDEPILKVVRVVLELDSRYPGLGVNSDGSRRLFRRNRVAHRG